MTEKVKFTEEEICFIRKIGITFDVSDINSLSDEEADGLYNAVTDFYTSACNDCSETGKPLSADGKICESILYKLV